MDKEIIVKVGKTLIVTMQSSLQLIYINLFVWTKN